MAGESPRLGRRLTAIWALGPRLSRHDFDEFRAGRVEQGRADVAVPGKSPAAPRNRLPSAPDAPSGFACRSSGTRPVLKSRTDTRLSSISSRSAVPAITRPSGKVAASGASPSEPGPNSGAKAASDNTPQTWSAISSRCAASATPADCSSQCSARSRPAFASTSASRSSSWWINVPRLAAARDCGVGGGAGSRSSASCDGASGRGGRGSAGAGARTQSGKAGGPSSTRKAFGFTSSQRDLSAIALGRRPTLRPLRASLPATMSARSTRLYQLFSGTPRDRLDPRDDQPLACAGHADVKQAPMLLKVAGLLERNDASRTARPARPCAGGSPALSHRRPAN